MGFFKNVGLKAKLMLGSCSPLILMVILGIVTYISIGSLLKSNHWVDHTHVVIAEAKYIEAAAVDMETGMRGFLLAGKEQFLDPYKGGQKHFYEKIKSLQETVNDNPAQVRLLGEIKDNIKKWQDKVTEPAIALRRKVGDGKTMDDVAALVGEARGKTYFDKFRGQIKTFTGREAELMAKRQVEAEETANNTNYAIIFGTIATMLIALVTSYFMSGSVVNPINRVIGGLNDGAEQVTSASGQVSASSQSLAEGSSEQAASIEETSSSLEEMSSMTKQNAENATQADNLMKDANQVVGQANHSMSELTESIGEISTASEETSKIIKTIDEIAFQTNLLALNAAVEAARAGEAGAGFAVVADEVRNLAMRAAEAAKNTAELIEGTVKKVSEGSDLVTRTNEAFNQVADSSAKVEELVAEIAAASDEQARGIDQINIAVSEMDKVTQSNAANAQESASASEEMTAQAGQMQEMVGELVALVGGSSMGAVKKDPTPGVRYRVPQNNLQKTLAVASARTRATSKLGKFHRAKGVNPEQIIPLDDDDFKDF
jgi:methyl-accepting chemotaxis protein